VGGKKEIENGCSRIERKGIRTPPAVKNITTGPMDSENSEDNAMLSREHRWRTAM